MQIKVWVPNTNLLLRRDEATKEAEAVEGNILKLKGQLGGCGAAAVEGIRVNKKLWVGEQERKSHLMMHLSHKIEGFATNGLSPK